MLNKEIMLINATQPEEIRVALVENNRLSNLDIDCPFDDKKKGNIYKAVVTRVEKSLGAVFVNYGSKRQGFLPLKEISPDYFSKQTAATDEDNKPAITSLLREGQELLVQVDKEERGNKGAALTTFITLAGRYLVLMPKSPSSGGISRRIEGEDRDELKETLGALTLPDGMGLIIRTAGVGKSIAELQVDSDMLCNQWQAILQASSEQLAPCLIHQEEDVIIRSIRDNLKPSVSEVIIDELSAYVKAKRYLEIVKPDFLNNLKLYKSNVPLFNLYQIESQIEAAYQREVALPSGGALVIDRTEALVSIDVNSAKATSGTDIETTAVNTNLEAADEIARQLRLRDLGGLVVIDFIDMSSTKNQKDVENRLKEALKADRARIQVGRISRFGLLEMSRQRLRLSLGETAQEPCPRCQGRGTVRNIQSHGLSLTRLIEEEALKEKTAEVHVQLPVEMATFLMNEKRDFILDIEKRHSVSVVIVANPYLHMPHYNLSRIKEDNASKANKKPSYQLIEQPEVNLVKDERDTRHREEPAVKAFSASKNKQVSQLGFIKRIWSVLFGQGLEEEAGNPPQDQPKTNSSPKTRQHHSRQSGDKQHNNQHHHSRRRRLPGHNNPQQKQQGQPSQGQPSQGQHSHTHQTRRKPTQSGGGKVIPMRSATTEQPVPKKKETKEETE